MEEETRGSKLRSALVTIFAVWVILILAGLSGAGLQPSIGGGTISIAVCIGLLFAWGQWTAPGRRTILGVYLLAGLLYPVMLLTLLFTASSPSDLRPYAWLGAGLNVGFQPHGGADTPFEFYVVPMVLNLIGPILVMGTLRAWLRGDLTT
jgi:hypothetical protein